MKRVCLFASEFCFGGALLAGRSAGGGLWFGLGGASESERE